MKKPTSRSFWSQTFPLIVLLGVCLFIAYLAYHFHIFASDNQGRQLKFVVQTSGGYAAVTLTDSAGNVIHSGVDPSPWELTRTLYNGEEIYLTATNPSQVGTLSCQIFINSSLWKQQTATSPADKVACAGIVP
ncbi:MAG: hypothetical protein PHQ40_18040 [Anaerolineaceae bacterium]|nr:hypothetical protein [Anaerolineaceae bacterium]